VIILGQTCFEGTVASHATQVFAANLTAWLTHFWDDKAKTLRLDPNDEILKGSLITQGGAIVHPQFKPKA
jgi:NAD(P) transhydrogenase subunit alpha